MSVLRIGLLDTRVGGGAFGVFFQIVELGVGDNAGGGYGMTDMLSQRNLIAAHFPSAAIAGSELEFVGAVALGQATGYGPYA